MDLPVGAAAQECQTEPFVGTHFAVIPTAKAVAVDLVLAEVGCEAVLVDEAHPPFRVGGDIDELRVALEAQLRPDAAAGYGTKMQVAGLAVDLGADIMPEPGLGLRQAVSASLFDGPDGGLRLSCGDGQGGPVGAPGVSGSAQVLYGPGLRGRIVALLCHHRAELVVDILHVKHEITIQFQVVDKEKTGGGGNALEAGIVPQIEGAAPVGAA